MNRKDLKTGDTFTATIDGTKTRGVVHKSLSGIYLCQNEVSGALSPNKHGYKHSFYIGADKKGVLDFGRENVTGFKVRSVAAPTPKKTVVKSVAATGKVVAKAPRQKTVAELEKELAAAKAKQAAKEATKIPTRFRDWEIRRDGPHYVFGCGAVRVTVEEMRRFTTIYRQMRARVSNLTPDACVAAIRFLDEGVETAERIVALNR